MLVRKKKMGKKKRRKEEERKKTEMARWGVCREIDGCVCVQ